MCIALIACGGGNAVDQNLQIDNVTQTTETPPPPPPPPPPPVAETVVTVEKREGDYFKPVVITVVAEGAWEYQAQAGNVTETDTGLHITSDGQLGVYSITIDGEESTNMSLWNLLCANIYYQVTTNLIVWDILWAATPHP